MGKGYRFADGNVAFAVDDGVERLIRAALEVAAPGVLARVTDAVTAVANEAHADWPVKTGRSRAALNVVTVATIDDVRVRIYNTVPYVYYIKPAVLGGRLTAWATYVQKPVRDVARHVAADVLGPGVVADITRAT